MIMAGSNISAINDPLHKIQEEYLYNSIRKPKPAIAAQIRQLRIIYDLDPKQYSILKKSLPYIVCGIFNPPYRRKENFGYTETFIIDIDHLSEKELSLSEVRTRIQADERVVMCFSSPIEDGLKVMFHLSERCHDAGLYSIFYKAFLQDFSCKYHLEQVIDSCTSDVSRACFISTDPDAYYNAAATSINMNAYINIADTTSLFDMKRDQEKAEKQQSKQNEQPKRNPDPDKDIMEQIKARLNPKLTRIKETKSYFVPEKLNMIIDDLKQHIEQENIRVTEIANIQYGKKIRCALGKKNAEINLFYGKKGFSVVKSPKTGTSEELNELMQNLILAYVTELEA